MIANVATSSSAGVRFVFPSGTYSISSMNQVIYLRTNWVVLSGMAGARLDVSHTSFSSIGSGGCTISDSDLNGASAISICKPGHSGTPQTWTSGFNLGDRVIGTPTTAGFTVGQYAHVRVSRWSCTLVPHPTTAFSGLAWLDKVVAINPNVSVTLEHGLPISFPSGCRSSATITPKNGVEGAGIENLDIYFTNPTKSSSQFKPAVSFAGGTTNSWIVDSKIADFDNQAIVLAHNRGNWVRGNVFSRIDHVDSFNTTNVEMREGASDNVYEDNYCVDSAVCVQERGALRNVVAYNYMRQDGAVHPERSIFLHGDHASGLLIEGNDVDQTIQLYDEFWGGEGPFNTAYRNRNVDAADAGGRIEGADGYGSMGYSDPSVNKNVFVSWGAAIDTATDTITKSGHRLVNGERLGLSQQSGAPGGLRDGWFYFVAGSTANTFQLAATSGGAPVDLTSQGSGSARLSVDPTSVDGPLNVIANSVACLTEAGGSCAYTNSFNRNLNEAWIERNTIHSHLRAAHKATTSWGVSLNEPPSGNNEIRSTPHSSAALPFPNTLYRDRSTPPTWWCQEACSWDYNGIGAFGDDHSGGLCKLPAQIRAQGGTCSAMSGAAPPPVPPPVSPPAAPTLLP